MGYGGVLAAVRPKGIPRGAFAFEAEAIALFARMSVQPDATRKGHINTLIAGLKSAGIWAECDLIYVLAAHDAQAAKLNWKSTSFDATEANAPAFVADQGFTGNGTTSYLATGYTPSTHGVKFVQDSASMWVWSRTTAAHSTSTNADVGSRTNAPGAAVGMRNSANNQSVRINDGTTLNFAVADGLGLGGAQRRAATDKRSFKNGVEVAAAATASTGLPADEQWVCAAHSTAAHSTRQIAFAMWASALSGLEASLYSAVQTYLQAVGAA